MKKWPTFWPGFDAESIVDNDAEGLGAALNSGDNVVVMNDVDFRDNGSLQTSTGNLRLQQGSLARDQGNNSFVAGISTDLDGEARIFGGTVDLGPYEGTALIFADGFEDWAL
ncbi:MAG: hypothetical protein LC637_07935 [Xanthomonadaceae bacterium]|nr:hypothetical protein [Xanthomonadaceae bacterium]